VDVSGVVKSSRIRQSSGYEALDSAAMEVSHQMRFVPATNGDRPVPVFVNMPVVSNAARYGPNGG
jgi:TonB family protein